MSNRISAFMCIAVVCVLVVFALVVTGITEFSDLINLKYSNSSGRCAISYTDFGDNLVFATNSIFLVIPFMVRGLIISRTPIYRDARGSGFTQYIGVKYIIPLFCYLLRHDHLSFPQVTLMLYIHIFYHIATRKKASDETAAKTPAKSIKKTHKDKIFVNITMLLVLYFISWFPYYVVQYSTLLSTPSTYLASNPSVRAGLEP
eukprot:sb/3470576/